MLMAPFYVHKIIEIHHTKKHLVTSLIFIFKISKILENAYNGLRN
jgi:hypothetical protein